MMVMAFSLCSRSQEAKFVPRARAASVQAKKVNNQVLRCLCSVPGHGKLVFGSGDVIHDFLRSADWLAGCFRSHPI
jgi:hypothetical protein